MSAQSAKFYPRRLTGTDGHPRQILYNRNIERSGHVAGSTSAALDGNDLLYRGGPIQGKPRIYVVYWGRWDASNDPQGVRGYLNAFLKGMGDSNWLNTAEQYSQTGGTTVGDTTPGFQVRRNSWNDASAVPDLSDPSSYGYLLASEAQKAAAHFSDYSTSASYVLAIEHNAQVADFGPVYCAWHSYTTVNGFNIAYTNLPYTPDAGFLCGQGAVNTPGYDDGVSIVEGHEQAETETDPQLNAWFDANGQEIGDKCAWLSLQDIRFSSGTFPTQPLWSNAVGACVQ